jgi:hypothetical protein
MTKLSTLTLTGVSGAEYLFDVYEADSNWNYAVECVYYISHRYQKADRGWSHTTIYIGETEDLRERLEDHHKQSCFDRHNYNAVSVHQDRSSVRRLEIETDLIEALSPPCND